MAKIDFEELVRTGPETVMGELMRRYWVPALLAAELPAPDCPPVRVTVLSEPLIGFRDSTGQPALVSEFCAHRHASLFFARNEECGLRCAYHGWKYDASGACVDMPSEPETSRFKEHVSIRAYPARERGGIIWAYLGPPADEPPLPELEWALVPPENRFVSKRIQESNWLQALEGGIDSSHVSFLHRFNLATDPMHQNGKGNEFLKADSHPRFETATSAGGLLIAARRNATEDEYYWRITQYLLPWYTLIPPFGDHPLGGHAWVPIDDTHCWVWNINFHPSRPLSSEEVAQMESGAGIHAELIPGTFRPVANATNDYLIDRKAQLARRSFSGVGGFGTQDQAIQETMGAIQPRDEEHLGTSDIGIMMARRRLHEAALALRDHGTEPPGRDAGAQRVRPASLLMRKGVSFDEGAGEALVADPGRPVVSL
ncbi:MAG TPA: aromatic ring-hydroxylating dioxygenase subunit alpha [Acidimicrobiales bacterium]|nr:aromatic ring-hydroxylating dioxygenase subunit alpha [Acidimicrobiales bacterium]